MSILVDDFTNVKPNPGQIYPRRNDKNTCYLKNVVQNPNIIVGDFTFYNDFDDPIKFEKQNVLYHYPINNDKLIKGDIVIGNDVWIGYEAVIMPGVHISDGAIIGTRAVVTKNVPPYGIVGGVPSQIIKYRFDDPTIQMLLNIKWWDWDIQKIKNNLSAIRQMDLQKLKELV